MEVDLVLIAPASDKSHSKMGFVPLQRMKDLEASFERNAKLVSEHTCMEAGCGSSTQLGKRPHNWTCYEHDPMTSRKKAA